jgi:mono/diheme cytochrome c family protein
MRIASLFRPRCWLAALGLAAFIVMAGEPRADEPDKKAKPTIDFKRQIRPILSENCFACHGPDEKQRKAKLRLDTKEGAFAKLRDGGFAIVPGKASESELVARTSSHEPGEMMPPPKSGKKLRPEQIALLKQWVEQGAPWSSHWAFAPPTKPEKPNVRNPEWCRTPVDAFVLAKLEAAGLQPSPETDKSTLIRRVTLDLTGLPPTPAEVDAFLADDAPNAFEKVVDRLLRSSRYGEHMARYWLDAARYGDTHGLHLDNYREIWPYRDWVINAFNANMPFDRFIVEQLAGDLEPSPTLQQIIATGYNRCHVSTSEGGSIDEEVYVRNVDDQVDTNGNVFLGLSVGCARCHDHKYDPITQKDYYQLFAFFNNIDGPALDGNAALPAPSIKVPSPEHAKALAELNGKADAIRKQISAELAKVSYDETADAKTPEQLPRSEYVWIDDAVPAGAKAVGPDGVNAEWKFVTAPAPVFSGGKSLTRTADGLSQMVFEDAKPGLRIDEGDVLFAHVYLDPAKPPKEIMLQWHTDTWRSRAYWGDNLIDWGKDKSPERRKIDGLPEKGKWVRLEVEAAKVGLKPGTIVNGWAFTQHGGTVHWDKAGLMTRTPQGDQPFDTLTAWVQAQQGVVAVSLPKEIQDIVKLERVKRSDAQKKQLLAYFLEHAYTKTRPNFDALHKQLAAVAKEREAIEKKMPATLVFKERADLRPAYILKRGEYDQRSAQVGRDTPAFLPPLPSNAPRNRLGFAQWLVDAQNPLTARVAVNRFWQQVFGTGIVKTTEDFGSQGEPPSHPELLDWLAISFRTSTPDTPGWDVKRLMKMLVMSATYRQSSKVTPDRLAKDPANRLLSRGPRYRLDAEMLRDQALFVGGLLVEKLGGPSVKPPQPAGLWEAVGYVTSNTRNFVADTGHDKVHRRSLYTFWKRTAPPPQMTVFDAPSRESCTLRRDRTDTPLQALLMMNEKQFVECARSLAERTVREGGATVEDRLTYLFRHATARNPDVQEIAELANAYRDHLAEFRRDVSAAKKLIAIGETKADATLDAAELAAWTMTANLVLNLDEVMNKG